MTCLPGNFTGGAVLSATSPPVAMVLETTSHDGIAIIATVAASAATGQIPNGLKGVLPCCEPAQSYCTDEAFHLRNTRTVGRIISATASWATLLVAIAAKTSAWPKRNATLARPYESDQF